MSYFVFCVHVHSFQACDHVLHILKYKLALMFVCSNFRHCNLEFPDGVVNINCCTHHSLLHVLCQVPVEVDGNLKPDRIFSIYDQECCE